MRQRESFASALGVCLIVYFAQTHAFYRECNDAYCFSIPDQYGDENTTLDSAQAKCRKNSTTLLAINGSEVQRYVAQFLNSVVGVKVRRTSFLLNARRHDGVSWEWINGQSLGNLTVGGQDGGYVKFGYIGRENGVIYIRASLPTERRSYICEIPPYPLRGCSFRYGGRCYIAIYANETWFSARDKCLEMESDLASFDNITDNAALMGLDSVVDRPLTFWVGLRKTLWISSGDSNTEVKYTNWKEGYPIDYNKTCICLSSLTSEWRWVECDCDAGYIWQYFCLSDWQPHVDKSVTTVSRTYNGLMFFLLKLEAPWKSLFEAQRLCEAYDQEAFLAEIYNATMEKYFTQFLDELIKSRRLMTNQVIVNAQIYEPMTWNWVDEISNQDIFMNGQTGNPIAMLRGYLRTSYFRIYVTWPTDKRKYICQFTNDSTCCSEGFCYMGKCYRSFNDSLTWYEARNECLMNGGDLASFEGMRDENLHQLDGDWLLAQETYWVGAQYWTWKWQKSGYIVKYTDWAEGQPVDLRKRCICLQTTDDLSKWQWVQCNCTDKFEFVCSAEANTMSLSTLSTISPIEVTSLGTSFSDVPILNAMILALFVTLLSSKYRHS